MPHAVELIPGGEADRDVLQAMGRFYVYDISEFTGWPCPPVGLYECADFGPYWSEPGAHCFFIEVAGERAGFVLIDRHGTLPRTEYNVAEFFVLRKFKGRGIGRIAATMIFDRFRGPWEVMQLLENSGAIAFWRKVIAAYTGGRYHEARRYAPHLEKEMNVISFDSRAHGTGVAPARI
jgi:predicted acetyltransferase